MVGALFAFAVAGSAQIAAGKYGNVGPALPVIARSEIIYNLTGMTRFFVRLKVTPN